MRVSPTSPTPVETQLPPISGGQAVTTTKQQPAENSNINCHIDINATPRVVAITRTKTPDFLPVDTPTMIMTASDSISERNLANVGDNNSNNHNNHNNFNNSNNYNSSESNINEIKLNERQKSLIQLVSKYCIIALFSQMITFFVGVLIVIIGAFVSIFGDSVISGMMVYILYIGITLDSLCNICFIYFQFHCGHKLYIKTCLKCHNRVETAAKKAAKKRVGKRKQIILQAQLSCD